METNGNPLHSTTCDENSSITREEYMRNLNNWLEHSRLWEDYCRRYTSLLCYQVPFISDSTTFRQTGIFNQFHQQVYVNRQNQFGDNIFTAGTYEFVIPPIWKRFVAEVLDFLILLVIKMLITFAAVESFNFITVDNYGFDTFEKYLENPKLAMQMSIEILSLELLHRCIVCCYEVYWLRGGPCATPGKRYMGLMVIQVENIFPVPGHLDGLVRVNPCSNLGVQKALIRAVLKSLFIGFMLPICFTMYIFRFNRTGYDVISKSMVVEYNPNLQPIH